MTKTSHTALIIFGKIIFWSTWEVEEVEEERSVCGLINTADNYFCNTSLFLG